MRLRLAWWAAAALVLRAGFSHGQPAPGKVYLVLGSDTAIWNVPGGVNAYDYHNHFSLDLYTQPDQNACQVMDPAFRQQFADAYGHPLKMTWWMLVGSVYGQSDNTDVPIVNLMPLYLMQKYHGAALRQFGDELTLHYHTFYWSDYSGAGVYYWNEAQSFHVCRRDFDQALAQSLLEEDVFPVSFRSGWHYMDNEWQNYLNQLLLYSMDNDSPNYGAWYTNGVIFNVLDWSQAPLDFIPFNPSPTNYQVPGDSPGWNVRSVKLQNVTQTLMNQIFAAAAAGTDQVASLWAHLPESDFLPNLVQIDRLAHLAATNYPTVPFLYCTAIEAMQRWRGLAGQALPQLDLSEEVQGDTVTLRLRTDKPIFQPQPFVAVKDLYGQYSIVPCLGAGTNSWTAVLPVPRGRAAKYGVAVTDLAGNLTTRIARYVPDDLFIDDLDSAYQEVSGEWTSVTNADCWGLDARISSLATNPTAWARWVLPITAAGSYSTFVQVPPLKNPAGQVQFDLLAGGTNVLSVFFTDPLPSGQWVYLGTALLNPGVTNVLDMVVRAQGQTNRFAVADVVKLSPLILPLPGFIRNVHVEPYDTTAIITWNTPAPATSWVEYGLDPSCSSFSATNSQPVLNGVVTLTGLQSGATYYFYVRSTLGELEYTYDGNFTTTNFASAPPPQLHCQFSGGTLTLYWNGSGLTLQQADSLGPGSTNWTDLPGPITVSPCRLTVTNTTFFRLRE